MADFDMNEKDDSQKKIEPQSMSEFRPPTFPSPYSNKTSAELLTIVNSELARKRSEAIETLPASILSKRSAPTLEFPICWPTKSRTWLAPDVVPINTSLQKLVPKKRSLPPAAMTSPPPVLASHPPTPESAWRNPSTPPQPRRNRPKFAMAPEAAKRLKQHRDSILREEWNARRKAAGKPPFEDDPEINEDSLDSDEEMQDITTSKIKTQGEVIKGHGEIITGGGPPSKRHQSIQIPQLPSNRRYRPGEAELAKARKMWPYNIERLHKDPAVEVCIDPRQAFSSNDFECKPTPDNFGEKITIANTLARIAKVHARTLAAFPEGTCATSEHDRKVSPKKPPPPEIMSSGPIATSAVEADAVAAARSYHRLRYTQNTLPPSILLGLNKTPSALPEGFKEGARDCFMGAPNPFKPDEVMYYDKPEPPVKEWKPNFKR